MSIEFKTKETQEVWIHTNIYGPVDYVEKEEFWGELAAVGGWWDKPWCMCGDFNATKTRVDKMNGRINKKRPNGSIISWTGMR